MIEETLKNMDKAFKSLRVVNVLNEMIENNSEYLKNRYMTLADLKEIIDAHMEREE